MEALQKLQNYLQNLIILWPVYTQSIQKTLYFSGYFKIFHFGILLLLVDSNLMSHFSFEYLGFSNKEKTTILLPSPLMFLQLVMECNVNCEEMFLGKSTPAEKTSVLFCVILRCICHHKVLLKWLQKR